MYGPTYKKPGANLLKMIIFLCSILLSTTAEKVPVASKGGISLDGKSTLFGISNFGQNKRTKFEDAVKESFSSSANVGVSIVKVTYSSACSNAVRRRLTEEERELQETEAKNVPSTHVSYTVTTDDNVNMNINQAKIDVTDSINTSMNHLASIGFGSYSC